MKRQNSGITRTIAAVIAVVIIAAGTASAVYAISVITQPQKVKVTLTGAGATFPFPLIDQWRYQYSILYPNIQINYQSIGSGAGIAQITAKTVDFGASDAPMSDVQYAKAPGILHIPETIGSVVPAYNLPGISTGLNFSGTVLADIFLGKVTTWNDPEITSLNPRVTLPAQSIFVVHRSDGSGTTFVWTSYLSDASSQWNSTYGRGTSINWPVGLGAKGNEGVGGVIQGNKYSFGYLELAYTITQKVTYGAVKNAAGNFVLANITSAAAAVNAAALNLPSGNASWSKVSIVDRIFSNTGATTAYPITSFTYLLVYQKQTDQNKGTALVNFLWWAIHSGQQYGPPLGYVPLPQNVVSLDEATIKSITYNGQTLYTGA
jgi:phosphate ABC transporter phosphate-binding protein